MTVQNDTRPAWHSRAGDTPESLAETFRHAATLIRDHGYNPCATSAGQPADGYSATSAGQPADGYSATSAGQPADGYSATSAIEAAAGAPYEHVIDQADAAEEALTRFAGFLYLTGLATRRTSVYDITDTAAGQWEACRPGEGWRTCTEVAAVLDAAAAMLGAMS